MNTLEKKLRLPWSCNSYGSFLLQVTPFTATVTPIFQATAGGVGPFSWRTQVTVASESRVDFFAEYGGCVTSVGMKLVECFLFDRSIGVPHLQKQLAELSKKSKPTRSKGGTP